MDAEQIANFIVSEYGWIALIMTLIVALLVELIKWPLKKLTGKITDERLRKLANKSIILISFGLAFLLNYLGNMWFPQYIPFSIAESCAEGSFANILYALVEGVITTSKAKELTESVSNATAEAKDAGDTKESAVSEFKKLLKK